MTPQNLASKIILCDLSLKAWSTTKNAPDAARDVENRAGARERTTRVAKRLVDPKHPACLAITKVTSAIRATHYELTLDWTKQGLRVLPVGLADEWTHRMSEHEQAYNAAANDFAIAFSQMKWQAEKDLGSLFEALDYPFDGSAVRGYFAMRTQLIPLPNTDPLGVLTGEAATKLQSDTAALLTETVERAQDCYVQRLRDALTVAQTRLGGEGGFHASLIGNLRDLCSKVSSFNITDDPNIAALADDLLKGLANADPLALKNNPQARTEATAEATTALARIQTLTTDYAGVF